MSKLCFFCGRFMGKKYDNHQAGIFYSVCDECGHRLRLGERLPDLLFAIAALRRQNDSIEQSQTSGALVTA